MAAIGLFSLVMAIILIIISILNSSIRFRVISRSFKSELVISDNESSKLIPSNIYEYDSDENVSVISTFVQADIQQDAIETNEIMEKSDQIDNSLKFVYDHVIDSLELSRKEKLGMNNINFSKDKLKPDFYSSDFLENLISSIKDALPLKNDSFWYNLIKLVFKWMIHRREETVNIENGENSFENSLNDIKEIASIIKINFGISIPINFDLKSMNLDASIEFRSLLKYEFLENKNIFHSFADSIKDFRDNINDKEEVDNEASCQLLKIKHFNGHFDKNVRLEYLIFHLAPIKEMRNCILINDPHSEWFGRYSSILSNKDITDEYLTNLRIKGLKTFVMELPDDGNYSNKFALNLMQSHDRKFKMTSMTSIRSLLRMLNREGLLTWKMVKSLAGFPLADKSLGWNQEEFDNDLKSLKRVLRSKNLIEFEGYLKELNSQSSIDEQPNLISHDSIQKETNN